MDVVKVVQVCGVPISFHCEQMLHIALARRGIDIGLEGATFLVSFLLPSLPPSLLLSARKN